LYYFGVTAKDASILVATVLQYTLINMKPVLCIAEFAEQKDMLSVGHMTDTVV
jgi:hypothetical protein